MWFGVPTFNHLCRNGCNFVTNRKWRKMYFRNSYRVMWCSNSWTYPSLFLLIVIFRHLGCALILILFWCSPTSSCGLPHPQGGTLWSQTFPLWRQSTPISRGNGDPFTRRAIPARRGTTDFADHAYTPGWRGSRDPVARGSPDGRGALNPPGPGDSSPGRRTSRFGPEGLRNSRPRPDGSVHLGFAHMFLLMDRAMAGIRKKE